MNAINVEFTNIPNDTEGPYALVFEGQWSPSATYYSLVAAVHAGVASGKRFSVHVESGAVAVVGR